jgi:hypothetical protein
LTANEAKTLGLPVKVELPNAVMDLIKLYPQPVQPSGVARAARRRPFDGRMPPFEGDRQKRSANHRAPACSSTEQNAKRARFIDADPMHVLTPSRQPPDRLQSCCGG